MTNNNASSIEKHTILSLLPYAINSQLISKQQKLDDLNFTKTIVSFSIKALEAFVQGNLVEFDAQVGENLCQIRAYKILQLGQKWLGSSHSKVNLKKQIEQFKHYQDQLIATTIDWDLAVKQAKSFNKNLDGIENIVDFFERHHLSFELHDDIVFIITCYFLTHFNIRDKEIPVAINLAQVAMEFTISKYRAKRLVHRFQQLVCKSGCDFIVTIAKDLPLESGYAEILPSLYKIADEDRAVLPCYIVSEIIFNHTIQQKIPTLVIIKRFNNSSHEPYDVICFLLQGNGDHEFSIVPCDAFLEQHCMVVSGEVYDSPLNENELTNDYILRVMSETPLKLILANTAIHPQYSGKRLEQYRNNPFHPTFSDYSQQAASAQETNLINMQKFALSTGCCKQNPVTFFLKHIYANTITNEINKLISMYTGCAFSIFNEKLPLSSTGYIYEKQGTVSFKST